MGNWVIGVGGSASALAALSWADRMAPPDDRLHVVEVTGGAAASHSDELLSRLDSLRRPDSSVTVVHDLGHMPDGLVDHAGLVDADVVVIGAHVRRRGLPRRIGNTIRSVLDCLDRPIVVVPGDVDVDDVPGPVIAGVGHGEATEAAVRWAAEWADQHDLPLGLVRATGTAPILGLDGFVNVVAYHIDPTQRSRWAAEDLEDLAAAAQAHTADEIEIGTSAVKGPADRALVESAGGASLLVLGRHRGAFLGTDHVASTVRHVLTHARCPVALISPDG